MQAYEHGLINKLRGILYDRVIRITKLHSVVINKFKSQQFTEESKGIINKMENKIQLSR